MASLVALLVCQFIVAINGLFQFIVFSSNTDFNGLSNSVSVGGNVKVLPLVHKLVNINTLNNAGNVTINDIKKLVDEVGTNIDSLNNAQNGQVVINDIQKLSNTIKGSKRLLSGDQSVVRIGPVNSAIKKTYDVVKAIIDSFANSVKLTNTEKDLYLDVILSGSMGLLYAKLKDLLHLSEASTLSGQDPKVQLLNEVTFTKALANGFKKLRGKIVAGTKYAKLGSGGQESLNDQPVPGRKGKSARCKLSRYHFCMPPDELAEKADSAEEDVDIVDNQQREDTGNPIVNPNEMPNPDKKKKKLCMFIIQTAYCVLQEKS